MLEQLKQQVYEENLLFPKHNLVAFTRGNVSAIDKGSAAIKPSGGSYDEMKAEDIVIADLEGKTVEDAVHNAVVLDEASFIPYHLLTLTSGFPPMDKTLLDKHYLRKHGANAHYGQK